ncbi:MAG: hypothetical protein AMXMBFR53_29050 [Gemmatimonadota bacterium]
MPDLPLTPILRPVYQDGQLLNADDFVKEQALHVSLRELQTRLLCTPGVVVGLGVGPGPALVGKKAGSTLAVQAGVAFDPSGRVVTLVDHARFDGADVQPTADGFVLCLDDARWYAVGSTRRWYLTLSFGEEPVPGSASRLRPAPLVGLVAQEAGLPAGALILAGLAVQVVGTAQSLQIDLDPSVASAATLAPERLPGVPAAKLTGTLAVDQIPAVPAEKLTGTLSVDQLPGVPAAKITGTLAVDQIPAIPAERLTGTLSVDQLPAIPAERLTGPIALEQLPHVPAAWIEGPLGPDQVPAIPDILARLAVLEQRLPPGPQRLSLTLVSGDGQAVARTAPDVPGGAAWFAPLVVRVTDASGRPVAGASVTFSVGPHPPQMAVQIDPGTAGSVSVLSGADGAARLDRMGGRGVRAYYAEGPFTVIATAPGAPDTPPVAFGLEVVPPPPPPTTLGLGVTSGAAVVGSRPAYDFGTRDFSITVVFRTTGAGTVVSKKSTEGGSPTRAGWLLVLKPDGSVKFATDDGFTFSEVNSAATGALDGHRHTLGAVRRGGQLEIYLDGERLAASLRGAPGPLNVSGPQRILIGSCDQQQEPYRQFTGVLKNVTLWARALAPAEIQSAGAGDVAPQAPGLVGFWRLESSFADASPVANPANPSGTLSFVAL